LCYRSLALWLLGYPEAALADAEHALKDAREIGHGATLMYALAHAPLTHIYCGNYQTANAHVDEVVALADEKGAPLWKAAGTTDRGCVFALTGKASDIWMTQGWFRMSPAVRQGGAGGRCEQRFTSGLPKPITAPCGSLTQLAARLGTSAGTQLRLFQCTRWRSRAATSVSLMTLSATPPRYSA
jgi:hypothetical protein